MLGRLTYVTCIVDQNHWLTEVSSITWGYISFTTKSFVMQPLTDNELRKQAHKRVEFRTHLLVYCVIIGSLWLIWIFTGRNYPWPIWPMIGWGIGLIFHYLFDFRSSKFLSEEEEYKRLKRKNEEQESTLV